VGRVEYRLSWASSGRCVRESGLGHSFARKVGDNTEKKNEKDREEMLNRWGRFT